MGNWKKPLNIQGNFNQINSDFRSFLDQGTKLLTQKTESRAVSYEKPMLMANVLTFFEAQSSPWSCSTFYETISGATNRLRNRYLKKNPRGVTFSVEKELKKSGNFIQLSAKWRTKRHSSFAGKRFSREEHLRETASSPQTQLTWNQKVKPEKIINIPIELQFCAVRKQALRENSVLSNKTVVFDQGPWWQKLVKTDEPPWTVGYKYWKWLVLIVSHFQV